MKNLNKIFYFSIILAFSGIICSAQNLPVIPDTLKISQVSPGDEDNTQTQSQNQAQNQGNSRGQQQGNPQGNASGQRVKQIKSARPDFSKAKGARPNIKRPAGTGIPKGVGKPGGAGRKVGT